MCARGDEKTGGWGGYGIWLRDWGWTVCVLRKYYGNADVGANLYVLDRSESNHTYYIVAAGALRGASESKVPVAKGISRLLQGLLVPPFSAANCYSSIVALPVALI